MPGAAAGLRTNGNPGTGDAHDRLGSNGCSQPLASTGEPPWTSKPVKRVPACGPPHDSHSAMILAGHGLQIEAAAIVAGWSMENSSTLIAQAGMEPGDRLGHRIQARG